MRGGGYAAVLGGKEKAEEPFMLKRGGFRIRSTEEGDLRLEGEWCKWINSNSKSKSSRYILRQILNASVGALSEKRASCRRGGSRNWQWPNGLRAKLAKHRSSPLANGTNLSNRSFWAEFETKKRKSSGIN